MLWRCRSPVICWCLGMQGSPRPHSNSKGQRADVATPEHTLAGARSALLVPRAQQAPTRQP